MKNSSFLVITASTLVMCQSFLLHSQPQFKPFGSITSTVDDGSTPTLVALSTLYAEKRRRRRRDQGNDGFGGGETPSGTSSRNELPDFDLGDEEGEAPKPKRRVITNPDEITPAMMGNANAPVGSVRDLLMDRSLESKLEFDEVEVDNSLPDLLALSRERGDQPVGTKKARKAERRAAALAAKEAEPESIFANLPFVSNDEGKVRPVKILEAGAWAGIILLFAWEVYLNSPFFDRAAPMAPVVFESLVM
jgi:hypothetical protein